MSRGRIDLHLHLLANVDDGPEKLTESVEMTAALAELGYTILCCTPHQRYGYWAPSPESMQSARVKLQEALLHGGSQVELLGGAEYHFDGTLLEQLDGPGLATLANGDLLLLELPDLDPGGNLETLLFELQTRGLRPLIAHPERHSYLFERKGRLQTLEERGALLQVAMTTIGGKFGRRPARRAEELLRSGQAHVVATDAHSRREVEEIIRPALQRLVRLVGEQEAWRLTSTAPAALLGLDDDELSSDHGGTS